VVKQQGLQAKFLKLAGLSLRARFTFPATRKSRSSFGLDHVPSRFRFTPSLQAEAKKNTNSSMRVELTHVFISHIKESLCRSNFEARIGF
jgi:hypothetical protein